MKLACELARCTRAVVAAFLAAAALLAASAQPAAAECNPAGADPSFRRAAPYAARIVVGRVVPSSTSAASGLGPGWYRFTLEVEDVLRGSAPPTLVLDHLETGGCIRWLSANEGDRIVLALDVDRSDATVAWNTAAWLVGDPPAGVYETISLDEVAELARARMPETSTDAGRRDEVGAGFVGLSLGALAAALWVEAWRHRRGRYREEAGGWG